MLSLLSAVGAVVLSQCQSPCTLPMVCNNATVPPRCADVLQVGSDCLNPNNMSMGVCADGSTCDPVQRVCTPYVLEGEACTVNDTCVQGTTCTEDPQAAGNFTCTLIPSQGCQCPPDQACSPGTTMCVDLLGIGDECMNSSQPLGVCIANTSCTADSQGMYICSRDVPVPPGSNTTNSSVPVPGGNTNGSVPVPPDGNNGSNATTGCAGVTCQDDEECMMGNCVPVNGTTPSCSCMPGYKCNSSAVSDECVPNWLQEGEVCLMPNKVHGMCPNGTRCLSDATGTASKCMKPPHPQNASDLCEGVRCATPGTACVVRDGGAECTTLDMMNCTRAELSATEKGTCCQATGLCDAAVIEEKVKQDKAAKEAEKKQGYKTRSFKVSLRTVVEDLLSNPKNFLRRFRRAMLKTSAALRKEPQSLIVTMLKEKRAGGKEVPIPREWNTALNVEELSDAGVLGGTAASRVAVFLQGAQGEVEAQYDVTGKNGATVDTIVKDIDSEMVKAAGGKGVLKDGSQDSLVVDLAAGKPTEVSDNSSSDDTDLTWLWALVGTLGGLAICGGVAGIVYRSQAPESQPTFQECVIQEEQMNDFEYTKPDTSESQVL